MGKCAVVGCERWPVARGLCGHCYSRWRKCLRPKPAFAKSAREYKAFARDEVTLRREAGESIADIAAAVSRDPATVRRWLAEWGVSKGTPGVRPENSWRPWTETDIEFAVTRTDLSEAERATALGRTVNSILECVRKHGSK